MKSLRVRRNIIFWIFMVIFATEMLFHLYLWITSAFANTTGEIFYNEGGFFIFQNRHFCRGIWATNAIGSATVLNIKSNLPPVNTHLPWRSQFNSSRGSLSNERKRNSRQPSWMGNGAQCWKKPSYSGYPSTMSIWARFAQGFSLKWAETKLKMAAMAAILDGRRGSTLKETFL